jgi:hypothetical protein
MDTGFLLSRIKEEWTPPTTTPALWPTAWPNGPVITAAIIMVFVFGSFLLESERHQDLRPRPRQRRAHRRHHRPHAPRAGHDGAGRLQLVMPKWLDHPAQDRRRGHAPHEPTDEPELVGASR